jgi:hypothetical protein
MVKLRFGQLECSNVTKRPAIPSFQAPLNIEDRFKLENRERAGQRKLRWESLAGRFVTLF